MSHSSQRPAEDGGIEFLALERQFLGTALQKRDLVAKIGGTIFRCLREISRSGIEADRVRRVGSVSKQHAPVARADFEDMRAIEIHSGVQRFDFVAFGVGSIRHLALPFLGDSFYPCHKL